MCSLRFEQANRITNQIYETYGIKPDFPWNDDNGVFRHLDTRKWFSLIMYVSLDALLKKWRWTYVEYYKCKNRYFKKR